MLNCLNKQNLLLSAFNEIAEIIEPVCGCVSVRNDGNIITIKIDGKELLKGNYPIGKLTSTMWEFVNDFKSLCVGNGISMICSNNSDFASQCENYFVVQNFWYKEIESLEIVVNVEHTEIKIK